MHTNLTRAAAAVLAALALVLASVSPAMAEAPSNDDIRNATPIETLPWSVIQETTEATWGLEDMTSCSVSGLGSVWYTFTAAASQAIQISTVDSSYNASITVLTGEPGFLNPVACGNYQYKFIATAGVTYYFMVTPSYYSDPAPMSLVFSLSAVPPPANDDFTNASDIPFLPYTLYDDATSATLETNEPEACPGYSVAGSVWYRFTAPSSEFITVAASSYSSNVYLGVYTGASLATLEKKAGSCSGGYATLATVAGTIYIVQLSFPGPGVVPTYLNLFPAQLPVAQFYFYPPDPSTFDSVNFTSASYDPGGSLLTCSWDFGDGTTRSETYASHRYAADGDYTVTLAATATDGRRASYSQTVQVRTRDVAITKFTVPQSARSGQTRQISVGVRNTRYPQSVTVTLYRSDPSGYVPVGSLTNAVPVRPSNRTTDFTFSYTFTGQDASYGKVTFKAVAQINDGRDALPADNEAISLPTRASK